MDTKYDKIGTDYDLTRKADPYLADRFMVLLQPVEYGHFLDIGCGTGNYTTAMQKNGLNFIGMDPSEKMLAEARERNSQIDWRLGEAANTGIPDESLNGILATLTIHHWPDLQKGFAELRRILKREGRMVIFTSTPKQMKGYWLNHYFPQMLTDSMLQMPSEDDLVKAMKPAGFKIIEKEKYFIKPDQQDHFLYCGKQRPELYLKSSIRNGISSFADLANEKEVRTGMMKLEKDMITGEIDEIIRSYENDLGDYLFVVAR